MWKHKFLPSLSAAQNKNLRFQPFNLSVSVEELHDTMTSKLYEIILKMSRKKQFKTLFQNQWKKKCCFRYLFSRGIYGTQSIFISFIGTISSTSL